jgi:acetyl esterase/lipase
LVSPWTDLSLSGASLLTRDAVDPLIDRAYLDELAAAWLGSSGWIRAFPFSLPILRACRRRSSKLTLLDDAVRFAAEAGTHGVFVTLEIWPNMIHAWHLWNAQWRLGNEPSSTQVTS